MYDIVMVDGGGLAEQERKTYRMCAPTSQSQYIWGRNQIGINDENDMLVRVMNQINANLILTPSSG